MKNLLFLALALLSANSFADTRMFDYVANVPAASVQVSFANKSDRRAFLKRFYRERTSQRILDLNNLRFADLDYDRCLTSHEYQMFLNADELWKKGEKSVREGQLRSFLSAYWILYVYQGQKEEFFAALNRIDKKIKSQETLYVLVNSVVRGKWMGPDNLISSEEVVFFEKSWNQFLQTSRQGLTPLLENALQNIGTCKTLPGPVAGKMSAAPLEVAQDIGTIIEGNLDSITTIDQWTGKAGTASYFGALYGKTKDPNHLKISLKLFDDVEKGYLAGAPDVTLTSGTTGMGLSALYAYKMTQEKAFLDIAIRFAKLSKLNGGSEYAEGATGIGIFKLNLYLVTKDPAWLAEAVAAGDLIVKNAKSGKEGTYWPMSPDFPAVFAGFGHGSAGIGYYLIHLYQLTKNEVYKTYAYKAADHVINTAYHDKKGNYHWTWYQPPMGYAQAWKYQWSHGNFGILYFFSSLRRFSPEKKWDLAFERTLIPALENGTGYRFDEGTQCCGKAGQGDVFLTLYRETGESKYLDLAKDAADYLVDSEGKIKVTFGRAKDKYDMSYSGLAGIGLFFLQLQEPGQGSLPYQIYHHE